MGMRRIRECVPVAGASLHDRPNDAGALEWELTRLEKGLRRRRDGELRDSHVTCT